MTSAILELPPEIFFDILALLQDEWSFAAALGIRSLSLSCHALYDFIGSYVSDTTDSTLDERIEGKWQVKGGLNVYCRRMAEICFLCNNRARSEEELFTGMLLCQACEAFHCQKISMETFKEHYEFYFPEDIRKLEWRKRKHTNTFVCQIDEVRKFHDENVIKARRPRHFSNTKLLEEFSFFDFSWMYHPWLLADTLKTQPFVTQSLMYWTGDWEIPRSPSQLDLTLYLEFRHQFDDYWIPPSTIAEKLQDWALVARHWVAKGCWTSRPWNLQNFPLPPGRKFPSRQNDLLKPTVEKYKQHPYHKICRTYREVFRNYPLSSVNRWLDYIEPHQKHYDGIWPGQVDFERYLEDFAFEIKLNSWKCDVTVCRQGRNLVAGNGRVGRTEIVRIKGDEVLVDDS
jgi:hypothetical protein